MESPPKYDFWNGGQFPQDPAHDSESLRLWNGDSESKRQALSPVSHSWFRITTSKSVGRTLIDTSDLSRKAIRIETWQKPLPQSQKTRPIPMPKAIHHSDSESQPPSPNCSLSRFRIKSLKSTEGDSESECGQISKTEDENLTKNTNDLSRKAIPNRNVAKATTSDQENKANSNA